MQFKILVYVDQTTAGGWALTLAEDLLRGVDASVILLSVEDNLKKDPQLLERVAAEITEKTGCPAATTTRPGPVREAILAESHASSPAVTIFPPAGRKGLARVFKGSRVKSVVHNSPSTVMVARKPVSDHIGRVLLTVSGGPMSETTVLSAREVSESLNAELTVLHVRSSVALPGLEREASKAKTSAAPPTDIAELIESLQWGREPQFKVRDGMVIREILQECGTRHYDLLVLGQHLADKEAGGPLSENIAELLALESPIPVMVIRPRRWAAGAKIRQK
ncbi:MAG: universal stress protein [Planctomycetes bacterium]|nr:universal stress protein [Planctomycetota bacterium]